MQRTAQYFTDNRSGCWQETENLFNGHKYTSHRAHHDINAFNTTNQYCVYNKTVAIVNVFVLKQYSLCCQEAVFTTRQYSKVSMFAAFTVLQEAVFTKKQMHEHEPCIDDTNTSYYLLSMVVYIS